MIRGRRVGNRAARGLPGVLPVLALAFIALLLAQAAVLPIHLATDHHRSHLDCHVGLPVHGHPGACDDGHDHDDHAHAAGDHQMDRVRRAPWPSAVALAAGPPAGSHAVRSVRVGPPAREAAAPCVDRMVPVGPRAPPASARL